jgi:hypothetical protein
MRNGAAVVMLCLTLHGFPVSAQVVRGRVSDYTTRQGLRGAAVTLADENENPRDAASTDTTGAFQLRASRAGNFRLLVSRIGYLPFRSEAFALRARETVQVAVQISSQPIPVTPLVISARSQSTGRLAAFESRRTRLGSGHFITKDEIDRRPLASPSSLLLGVRGVHLRPVDLSGYRNQVFMQSAGMGECAANLFVDGIPFRGSIDDYVIPDWLGAVEVYPTAAMTPTEFRLENACGAVLFWTKEPESGGGWSRVKIGVLAGLVVFAVALVAR